MKYTGTFNLDLLHEELGAIPGFVIAGPVWSEARYAVSILLDGIDVELLDSNLNQSDALAVVQAHDHTKESKAEKDQKKKEEDKQKVLDKLDLTKEEWETLKGA